MSSRRNGSVSRAAEAASKNRLHMDRNPQHSRINDPSHPAGRRKEIDNVMKRARQASPGSWDRKLLEVEEKDPNRWRHSGYKQLYVEHSGSTSPPPRRTSRSPLPRRSRTPLGRRSRSPISRRKSRSPKRSPRRTPVRRSPPPRRRRSPPARRPEPRPAPPRRPPSPPPPRKSTSESSVSSCSDEECSVCSANNKKTNPTTLKPKPPPPGKPPSPGRARPPTARAVQPTRELLKAREGSKRTREEKVLEWQRSQLNSRPTTIPTSHIKREDCRAPTDPRRRPPAPSAAAATIAALNDSDSDTASSDTVHHKLTLSERFGKMAQWSADRSARLENMKITRRETTLHVRIERDPPADIYPGLEPEAPVGSYPDELLSAAPGGVPSWDDVTVRYDYYKQRGFLRGLTLGDYVKWEEWWYKYQEWLERERAYERWADGEGRPSRRERRRKGGRHRRS